MKLYSRKEFLNESFDDLFGVDTKEICDEFDSLHDTIRDKLAEDPRCLSDDYKDIFDEITEFYLKNTNTTFSGVNSGKVTLKRVKTDLNTLQQMFSSINEGIIDTLKDSLPKINIPTGNLWPSFIKDIRSGKIKRDALGGLLPQVVKDIASGKLKDDALGDLLPPIIDDIKSGKMKQDMMDSLPPQFIKDVKSGKVTADIVGERPEILGKIKDMFI